MAGERDTSNGEREKLTIKLQVGHESVLLNPPLRRGGSHVEHTHRWTVFVRGPRGEPLDTTILQSVIFQLHDDFPNARRVVRTPPYEVTETGYAGFTIPIFISFVGCKKEFSVSYDMDLRMDRKSTVLQPRSFEIIEPKILLREKLLRLGATSSLPDVPSKSSQSSTTTSNAKQPNVQTSTSNTKSKQQPTQFESLFGSTLSVQPKIPKTAKPRAVVAATTVTTTSAADSALDNRDKLSDKKRSHDEKSRSRIEKDRLKPTSSLSPAYKSSHEREPKEKEHKEKEREKLHHHEARPAKRPEKSNLSRIIHEKKHAASASPTANREEHHRPPKDRDKDRHRDKERRHKQKHDKSIDGGGVTKREPIRVRRSASPAPPPISPISSGSSTDLHISSLSQANIPLTSKRDIDADLVKELMRALGDDPDQADELVRKHRATVEINDVFSTGESSPEPDERRVHAPPPQSSSTPIADNGIVDQHDKSIVNHDTSSSISTSTLKAVDSPSPSTKKRISTTPPSSSSESVTPAKRPKPSPADTDKSARNRPNAIPSTSTTNNEYSGGTKKSEKHRNNASKQKSHQHQSTTTNTSTQQKDRHRSVTPKKPTKLQFDTIPDRIAAISDSVTADSVAELMLERKLPCALDESGKFVEFELKSSDTQTVDALQSLLTS